MATIFIDKSDGTLAVKDCYNEKEQCSSAGCYWDSDSKYWKMVFTMETFSNLIKKIPNANIDPSLKSQLIEQQEKEDALVEIKRMSDANQDITFRVDGLKGTLFPYQKLGALYTATNGKGMLIGDSMGLGKAQPHGTLVYTSRGKTNIESLKIGDKIIGKNGKECSITGIYPQGVREIYRFTFNDGFYTDADINHLWEVQRNSLNTPKFKYQPVILSTAQLINKDGFVLRNGVGRNINKTYKYKTYYKRENGNNRWRIPIVEPICFEKKQVSIDPYLLGIFLGDGHICKDGTVKVKMLKEDMMEITNEGNILKAPAPHLELRSFNNLKKQICEFGLNGLYSWNKFIPKDYIYNSEEIRLGILQGLMDTDGNAADCATEYSTTSKQLCDDVAEIVQTLGGVVRIKTKVPTYLYKGEKKKGRLAYRLNIKLPSRFDLFRLKRKQKNHIKCHKYLPERYITKIEKLEEKKNAVCISVDAEDHLYVAEHCIVTHNTLQGMATALMLKQKGLIKDCLIITPASLKYNWPLEIEKFTNETYIVIDGKKPEDRIAKWLDPRPFFKIANYELVVEDLFGGRELKVKENETKEQEQKRLARKLKQGAKTAMLASVKNHKFGLLICDEAHQLKHTTSKRHKAIKAVKADIKVFLTGTPMDGRLEELYSLMNIIAPGLLGSRTHFFSRYVVTDFFGGIKGYKNVKEVQTKIQPFFIRRLKEDVLTQLPDKIYENKIISLSNEEKKIYDQIKKGKHPSAVNKDGSIAEPMVRAIRCKQFCDFPQMLDPSCKSSTKLDVFKELLEEVVQLNGNKAIIFTQYKQILNVIEQVIKDLKLKFLRIDGDTDKKLRADYQKIFNEDTSIDCIIGTEAMSTGLNLTGANTVFNYDDNWQPAIMAQRADRAHRYGQKDTVTIISFVCKDTIEEKIRKVLYTKDKLTAETLGDDTDEAVLKKLGPKELEDLM